MDDFSSAPNPFHKPLLFVLSGPSGSGKGTALGHIGQTFPEIGRVTTFTTRSPRSGETPGVDYNFITAEEFQERVDDGSIYEAAKTYGDYLYGSPRVLVDETEPKPLLVELEVKGMLRLRATSKRHVVSIFVLPPSTQALADRITRRHVEGNIDARLEKALDQIQYALAYDYVIVNDGLDQFLLDLQSVIHAELIRSKGTVYATRASLQGV
jgi:guanylate kinase